jgi:hypothetical protein
MTLAYLFEMVFQNQIYCFAGTLRINGKTALKAFNKKSKSYSDKVKINTCE